ncbi:hypothetical protein [Bacillus atrophaeus]|uniref:hypothetical protein n=1 Tax=Bacillus atrophaeus TaxID=1452 RepID=UPI002E2423D2|nr:hypothetical protein [Bacillus atrophaeus]
MPARFYFYDKDMKIIHTEISLLSFSHTGAFLAVKHNDEWKKVNEKIGEKTMIARTEIGVFEDDTLDSKIINVTIDNFEGRDVVICEFSPESPFESEDDEWFILRAKKENEELADRVDVKSNILI